MNQKQFEIYDFKDEVEEIIRKFERKENFVYKTSGSTGKPKIIEHSYDLIKLVAEENVRYDNITKDSYILNMSLPATSIGFPVLSVITAYITGAKLKIKKFNPLDYLNELSNGPTHAFMLPSIYRVMSKTDKWKNINLSSLMVLSSGADIVPEGMKNDVLSKGVKKFHQLYGSTEVPPAISNSESETSILENKSDYIDYFIAEDGELIIKWNIQTEYWKSGDIIDKETGSVAGRKNNLMKLNCTQIHPEIIEKYVLDNTNVNRALVKIEKNKVCLFYDGDESTNVVKKCLSDWYLDYDLVVRKVDKVKTNQMNKIIRTEMYL